MRISTHYKKHFADLSRERMFISSIAFFITFAIARGIAYSIHLGIGPFHNVSIGGKHIHHLVWGILLLLMVGYVWLLRLGTGASKTSRWMSRITALLFGVGAALTLDEFALWFNLDDVYWDWEGRQSIDAIIIFGGLLSIGLWGGRFLYAAARELTLKLGRNSR